MNKTKPADGEGDGRRKRRSRRGRQDEKQCNDILKFPYDIIVEIFCKIPIKTLIQCMCVCKSWRRSLSDPAFAKSLFLRAPTCLLVVAQTSGTYHGWKKYRLNKRYHILVDMESVSIPNNMVLKLSDPNALYNRHDIKIIGSCNGFLCLKRSDQRYNKKAKTDIFNISNPITSESIALPVDERMARPVHFGFGFSPISDVYKVVLFTQKKYKQLEVMVLTVGSGIWRRIGKVNVKVDTTYAVFHDGFLHWLCRSKPDFESRRYRFLCIRAFDVETERFKDIAMPPYPYANDYGTESHIGVLKGSLSITFHWNSSYPDTFSVWVMKEHGIAKSWTKELEINGGYFDINGGLVTRTALSSFQVLKFFDEGNVLLWDRCRANFHLYTRTRNLLKVEVHGTPLLEHINVVATVHPSFFSPKDIIRNYIDKHPEVGVSSAIGASELVLPAWTTCVAGWGENDDSELLEIPRGQPTPCLPLPEDLKYVSSTTATSLLDMISGLNALLHLKCMAGKDEIQRLKKENEDLRAKAILQLERKVMILYLMAFVLMPFMTYLALR